MKIKACAIVIGLALAVPAAAQELDTTQLQQSADYERNRILVRSALKQKQKWDARRSHASRAAATCANIGAARQNMGADHPKVQELARLCHLAGH